MKARAGAWLGAGFLLVALGGCAAESKQAPASPATGGEAAKTEVLEGEPATIEEAQARIERARAMLGGVLAGAGTPSNGAGTTSTVTPSLPPAVSHDAESRSAPGKAGADDGRRAQCATPCNAIASMRRAVEAICRMAGTDDARCTDARKTLGDSEAKVAPCGC
jgi:hypothetical protein